MNQLTSITDQPARCTCGWQGTVWDCEANEAEDSDGELLCPNCLAEVAVYASPTFNEIVALLDRCGLPVTIRYDPERAANRFTVIGPAEVGRLCDTDEPLVVLRGWLVERLMICDGCQHLRKSLHRSGRNPVYQSHCEHPQIIQDHDVICRGRMNMVKRPGRYIIRSASIQINRPNWCPILNNKELEA